VEPIRIQSFVAAEPAAVWQRLLGRPDVVLDALPVRAWPTQREEHAPSRLAVRWPFGGGGKATTTVQIALVPVSGGTRLDLRHDGWQEEPGWQDAVAGHFAGWLQALAALGLLVETSRDPRPVNAALAGRERYFASADIPAGGDAVYRALVDPEVLMRWNDGALAEAELIESLEGRFARWRLPGAQPARELVVILRHTPRGTHCALAEYGVVDRSASARWPKMLERLAGFLR
jgi:uncharacterized protein YndB with AHSA1/START domain